MRTRAAPVLLIALVVSCAIMLPALAARPDMGVLIHGPFGDVYYVFPKDQDTILIHFGGDGAAFSIFTETNALTDALDVLATGGFSGTQSTGVGTLDREITFAEPGSMEWSTAFGDVLASFTFSADEGTCGESFATDEIGGLDHIYLSIDIDEASDMWVYVVDGKPKNPKEPKIKLAQASQMQVAGAGGSLSGLPLQLTLVNAGDTAFEGEIRAAIGLAYYPGWVPEIISTFAVESLGYGRLAVGESVTLSVPIPPITQEAMDAFRAQRLVYASDMDRDPARDYIGIVLSCGGDKLFTWVPISESAPTVAMRKGK